MAKKPNKTEQGRQERLAEKAARAALTKGRRNSSAAAQSRSDQRLGRNFDEGSAKREANFTARENASGLNSLGNNTMSGRTARSAANPSFDQVGTPVGNDFFQSTNNVGGGGGGGGLSGIEVFWADGTSNFISSATILSSYNNQNYWSIVFSVTSNEFTKSVAYDATQSLYDDTGTDQTKYRLRVMTLNGDSDPVAISAYGQYRETIYCHNGEPITSLVKIS